jgi:hypothetical protein
MPVYKKISRQGGWNICYFVHNKKVIEILFSAKQGQLAGWSQNLLFTEAK